MRPIMRRKRLIKTDKDIKTVIITVFRMFKKVEGSSNMLKRNLEIILLKV